MNLKERVKNLKPQIKELYAFAYALIPDDLQAAQLVIDTFSGALVDDELSKFTDNKALILQEIFVLAKRRYTQVQSSLQVKGVFWQLSLYERAVLYLKYKEDFDLEMISIILQLQTAQVVSYLTHGKKGFFKAQGFSAMEDFSYV